MEQNTSHAVMAQRHEPMDSLDDFPTPPWATRALIEEIILPYLTDDLNRKTCLEPACNRGYMSRTLMEYFGDVTSFDVFDYGYGNVRDFLADNTFSHQNAENYIGIHDWTITNPPFKNAEDFIRVALDVSAEGVAMLTRTSFLEGVGRYTRLFSENPPAVVAQFTERVPMVKGRYDPKASTATSYCWLIWIKPRLSDSSMFWIPPCRKRLEKESDYV